MDTPGRKGTRIRNLTPKDRRQFESYQAIQDQDLFLLQTIVLVIAVLVVFVNVGIDILYRAVDPRIKLA